MDHHENFGFRLMPIFILPKRFNLLFNMAVIELHFMLPNLNVDFWVNSGILYAQLCRLIP